jgi:hypothetical protein
VHALWPDADLEAIRAALASAAAVALGAASGQAGHGDPGRRFRWLSAPRSVVVQPGPVHTGVTEEPDRELERIAARMLG